MSGLVQGRGIYTPADLRARCRVSADDGCWHWPRAVKGKPLTIWFPPLQDRVTLGTAACWWATGRRQLPGEAWHVTCATPHCANPAHRTCGTRSSQMLAARIVRTPQQRLRIAHGRRKAGKVSDAEVAQIRRSGETLAALAKRYGISVGYACELRSGKRRPYAIAPGVTVTLVEPSRKPTAPPEKVFSAMPIGSYLPEAGALAHACGGSATCG